VISKDQAAFAEMRYGLKLPTYLDAEDVDPPTAALGRAVARRLADVMTRRIGLRKLVAKHRADADFLLAHLNRGEAISETLDERMSMREAAERLADAEEQLEPLVVALYEATDEPHP
jgi:hypothetical protein